MKLTKTIIASVLVLGMGSAFADEPVALTETQMDNVTAAGVASAASAAAALGLATAATFTSTGTAVIGVVSPIQNGGFVLNTITASQSIAAALAQ